MNVTLLFIQLALKSFFLIFRETVKLMYLATTNATPANFVLFVTRLAINGSLTVTTFAIDRAGKKNPVLKIVEKEVQRVPKSKVMVSQEHSTAKDVIHDSAQEMKLVSMSFMAVVLTWIIKTATVKRRNLVASISELSTKT